MERIEKTIWIVCSIVLLLQMYACTTTSRDGAPPYSVDVSRIPNAVPRPECRSRYGNPEYYCVAGKKYYVMSSARGYCKKGLASWYGTKFHGKNTSSREPYDMFAMTAASPTLPIPTYVEVTNLENGKRIIVKVNDRGPFKSDRILDLSYAAARKLGFGNKGTANVEVRAIDPMEMNANGKERDRVLAESSQTPEIQVNPEALRAASVAPKPVKLVRYLQMGAFANRSNAQTLQEKIRNLTQVEVMIKEGELNNRPIYRVQIGPFDNAQASNEVQQKLINNGFDKVITVFS